ncbi:hypothetical protein [Mesorhizobium sp. WSM3879]|uniref:hypothetical protein n=1 Tax=Mesorhizobium sp. WSM3879 TaxID=2029406 RepID=UPI001FDFA8B5|nr:hypothetical protein [Mesorhizobium sp. WSM3879]
MMEYFCVDPVTAGGMDRGTVMDRSAHPPIVSKLVYQIDGWPGDVLIEAFLAFL